MYVYIWYSCSEAATVCRLTVVAVTPNAVPHLKCKYGKYGLVKIFLKHTVKLENVFYGIFELLSAQLDVKPAVKMQPVKQYSGVVPVI